MYEELGKIESVKFGLGGYQDCQIVFEVRLEGKSWSCFKIYEGGWANISKEELESPDNTRNWTHETRINQIGSCAWNIIELMKKAKVKDMNDLVGKPIRAFFLGQGSPVLSHFEILTEVL